MALEFRILGPLEVLYEGRPVRVGGRRERMLLAILLVHAREVVSTDRIFDELYGDSPPASAGSSLQNAVSKLRKALGAEVIGTQAPGYTIEPVPDALDAERFERLVAEAPADPAERSGVLHQALGLWRGAPLGDFEYEPFAQAEIARLDELRLVALEERVEADLALGKHAVLVGELGSLIAEHPFRERPRRQLMLALYGAGRQADALEAYQQARATFVDELGIEPSPVLRDLERAILQQEVELPAPPEKPPRAQVPAEELPERRQTATVLFVDIVQSTRLARTLDPEALREVMARYFQTVRRVLEQHGGTVEKFIGDAVLGVFGVPRVHEDDPLRAVRAGTAILYGLAELNVELRSGWGVEVDVRIGVNTGEVVAGGSQQLLATGEAVNLAKHLEEVTGTNELLVGETTWRLVRNAVAAEPVELADAGPGIESAWRVDSVRDAAPFARRLETPIVGRERELERLRQSFDRAVGDERAQLVTVLGPAGIGKTRLALELAAEVADRATVLTGRCPSFGEALTYWPLVEILQQAGEAAQDVVGAVLADGRTEELLPAVRRLFETLARDRPLVVVLEEIHWAEPTFLDLVEYLAEWIRDAPVLLLCLARIDLLEQREGWAGGLLNATSLLLEPLSQDESDAMVTALLGASSLDDAARSRILETAEGNPLFVEQLLSALLLGEAEELPPTIEALLAARLDRLGPAERAVVEVAAVAGREFTGATVADLVASDASATVDRHLSSLVRRELVRPLRSPVLGEEAFTFRHVLVRAAAYRSTPKSRRADLHRRFAARLDARTPGQDELAGYHLEQAYRLRTELRPVDDEARELASAAGERLGLAGSRAWRRGDASTATNLLARATALLPEGGRRREVRCELGLATRGLGDYEVALGMFEDLAEAAASAGDRPIELRARVEGGSLRLLGDRTARGEDFLELAQEAISVFERTGDERSLGRTWLLASFVYGPLMCRNTEWYDAAACALAHYERADWPRSSCLSSMASALYLGPVPVEEAIARCRSLLDDHPDDRLARIAILCQLGPLQAQLGELDAARTLAAEARERYEELGQHANASVEAAWAQGEIELIGGDAASAEQVLRENSARMLEIGAHAPLATAAANLAEVLYQLGRDEEAEEWTGIAREHEGPNDVSAQFSWRGVQAKILARGGRSEAAEALAREAASIAEPTDALNQQAKLQVDLADVLRLGGRLSEAADVTARALTLYEQKGNLVAATRTRALLSELMPA